MAMKRRKKTTTRRKGAAPRRSVRARRSTTNRLKDTWYATLSALTSAEENIEKQVRVLLKRNKISTKDASAMLKDLRTLIDRERKKGLRELESRLSSLQGRLRKERKVLSRLVNEAVEGTLASFNIPSRHEVAELTRKVDHLSRKIDAFKR
jgi:polyhydroxyalkanoate synthesis regulator phasin